VAATTGKIGVFNQALARVGESVYLQDGNETTAAGEAYRLLFDDLLRQVLEARPWPWAIRQQALTEISEQVQTATGDGATTSFDTIYSWREESQITVEVDGVEQVAGTDYSPVVAVQDGAEAHIAFTAAPALAAEITITVSTSRNGWDHVYAAPSDMVTAIGLLFEDTRFRDLAPEARGEFELRPNDGGDGYVICTDYDADDITGLEYVGVVDDIRAWPRLAVEALVVRIAAELFAVIQKLPERREAMMAPGGPYEVALSRASVHSLNQESAIAPESPTITARGGSSMVPWSQRWPP
jgi:hypothetical protein